MYKIEMIYSIVLAIQAMETVIITRADIAGQFNWKMLQMILKMIFMRQKEVEANQAKEFSKVPKDLWDSRIKVQAHLITLTIGRQTLKR